MHSSLLSLLFLSVAAILAFSVSVVTDAEARGSKGPKYERGGKVLSGKRVHGRTRVSMVKVKATKRPASCGTYMYWKDGRCQDARLRK